MRAAYQRRARKREAGAAPRSGAVPSRSGNVVSRLDPVNNSSGRGDGAADGQKLPWEVVHREIDLFTAEESEFACVLGAPQRGTLACLGRPGVMESPIK